jgi:SAM-dependent methyltransferase
MARGVDCQSTVATNLRDASYRERARVGEVAWRIIRPIVPADIRYRLRYAYYKREFHNYVRRKFGKYYRPESSGPAAPAELITTEALMSERDLAIKTRPDWYFSTGYESALNILTTLEQHSFDLANLRSVLEFGCGSARVVRHFRNIGNLSLAGSDANPKAIEWARQNLPGIDFRINALEPLLSFAEESFDLVYALSVFTHIPLVWQRRWLEELRRVLRPQGYLFCTVMGSSYVHELTAQDRAKLAQTGALTLDSNHPRAHYSTQVLASWDVYQTREQVREAFGAVFRICDYSNVAVGQDMLVLRRDSADQMRT